jgi:hypothetical protein
MITLHIESNTVHSIRSERVQVNLDTQVPPRGIWLWCQQKLVHSSLDSEYRDNICGFYAKKRLMTVASIVQELHGRLMHLLENHHTGTVTYQTCCIRLNQGNKRINARFSILDDEMTLQPCRNASSSELTVDIWTRSHLEKHCLMPWCFMLSPPCGPSATNHVNCLLVA